RSKTALVVVEPTSSPTIQTSEALGIPLVAVLKLTMASASLSGERWEKVFFCEPKREDMAGNGRVSFSIAHKAHPSASKYEASAGIVIEDSLFFKSSIITLFFEQPPMSMMFLYESCLSNSRILPAIIRQRPAATRAFGMPLFVACVQSLLQKTLHLPDTR